MHKENKILRNVLQRSGITLVVFACFCFRAGHTIAQVPDQQQEPEIGIVEHLGDTIPLDLKFIGENNDTVRIGDLINKPTILSLVFFTCPGICPQLLSGVADVIENVDLELGKDFDVLTVSFDDKDTPGDAVQTKKNYLRTKSKAHEKAWQYLTGDSTGIYSLTNSVGYKFKPAGLGFMHPACIIILSPAGKITRYLYGTSYLPFDLKMALIEARKGQPRPTINRVMEFCFTYDPDGRKYTLQVTKISATIIIFLALVLLIILVFRSRKRKEARSRDKDKTTQV